MSRAAERLASALVRHARASGVSLHCTVTSRPWCAALFDGLLVEARLAVALSATRDAWLAGLAEAELPIAGWCVADLAVDHADDDGALLSILLIARD